MNETATEKFIDIPISQLSDSPTNPRTITIEDEDIAELAVSIRTNGIIQPLIVRPTATGYEIAAGHRRKYGALKAGLMMVPCIIRVLSDDQIIDTHIVENIQRKDLAPMAEARTYQLSRDRGATLAQVVERSGKSEGYVNRRLSLNNLIPTFQADLDNGLPVEYGFELAKYPADLQADIEPNMYDSREVYEGVDITNGYVVYDCPTCEELRVFADDGRYRDPDEEEAKVCEKCGAELEPNEEATVEAETVIDRTKLQWNVRDISRWVANNNYDLDKAYFAMDATDLREDGLACINCPTRTGANAGLFGGEGKDVCLNSKCFEAKNVEFVRLTRERVGDTPLVARAFYGQTLPAGVLSTTICRLVQEDDETCDHVEAVEFLALEGKTEQTEGCQMLSGCKVHHWENRQGNSNEDKGDPEILARAKRIRKEEIWNVKVGEAVRRIVLIESAEAFGANVGDDASSEVLSAMITPATISRMWATEEHNHKDKVILPAIKDFLALGEIPAFYEDNNWRKEAEDYPRRLAFIENLAYRQQAVLLFLFTYGSTGAMFAGSWVSQDEVKAYAYLFGVNYELIDAKTRVELSTKKAEKVHQAYLQQVEVDDPNRVIPILFATDPKQPDAEATPEPESVAVETGTTEPSEPENEPESDTGVFAEGEPHVYPYECPNCGQAHQSATIVEGDLLICSQCENPEYSDESDEPELDEDEEPECDHSDARVCEGIGCAGIPDDTPSLDTSFHDHEMNVGDDDDLEDIDICEDCLQFMKEGVEYTDEQVAQFHAIHLRAVELAQSSEVSVYETDPVCIAMRNTTLFDESEIEGYFDKRFATEDFNPTQQIALRGILTEYARMVANLGDDEAEAGTCLSCGLPTESGEVCNACKDEGVTGENTYEEPETDDGISDEDIDELGAMFASKLEEAKNKGEN